MPANSFAALAFSALASLAGAVSAAPSIVVTWNQAALNEVRLGRLGPPVVARALAVAHTCMYDAWTSYDPRAMGAVVSTPRRPVIEHTDANKAKAVSFAAHRCLVNLFPAGATRLGNVMLGLGYDPGDLSTNPATPQGIGNAAASAVIASRRNDGANQYGELRPGAYSDYTGYAPANAPMPFCLPTTPDICELNVSDPYRWQPLINDLGVTQTFVAPHWENVRPFALKSAMQFDSRPEVAAGPNYLQSPQRYQADIDEILAYSRNLTAQQKLVVEYWADGPASELPPGHWSLFAQHVSQRDGNSIDKDVRMFFAMQNASFDAGIVAWHLKRKYDGVRPITSVRHFKQGVPLLAWGGPGRPIEAIDGGKWSPYNPGSNLTPSFPGYVSGHSTFSAASATVLRAFTGSDNFGYSTTLPPDFGRVEPGVPAVPTTIRYPTFTAAVTEAGLSRLYAGIHYSDDNSVGQALGNLAGQQAWAKAQYLFDGGLAPTTSSAETAGRARTLSWSHTVEPLSNRLLLVGVATTDTKSPVSVSYAGLPLARLGQQLAASHRDRVELWYRVAPPVGTAKVLVRLAGSDELVAGAMSFTGVHQTAPFGIVRTAASKGTSACITLANEPAPLVATVLVAESSAGSVTAGAGQLMRWNEIGTSNGGSGKAEIRSTGMTGPGAPVATICQTLSKSKKWAVVGVPLKPAQQP